MWVKQENGCCELFSITSVIPVPILIDVYHQKVHVAEAGDDSIRKGTVQQRPDSVEVSNRIIVKKKKKKKKLQTSYFEVRGQRSERTTISTCHH